MNKDDKRRCEILGLKFPPEYAGGCARFTKATFQQLQTLLNEGFAEADDAQNCAPEFQNIIHFLATHSRFTAHGYLVSPEREDCRVSIEGVEGPEDATTEELKAFVMFARDADEFALDPPFAWWD